MFEYTFSLGDFTLLTPFADELTDIQKEINQSASCIKSKFTYPNGFIIETCQYCDRIEVKTNKELIDHNDGTYSVKL